MVDFITQFANKKYRLEHGSRKQHINRIAIACNLLGIAQAECEAIIGQHFADKTPNKLDYFNQDNTMHCDAISYPYKAYSQSFGAWKYKLTELTTQTKIITAKQGQKLSNLLKGVNTDNCLIIAPTGIGKTFFAVHQEEKSIIVVPTNALLENIYNEYRHEATLSRYYGKHKDKLPRLNSSNVILTNYSSFKNLYNFIGDHISKR